LIFLLGFCLAANKIKVFWNDKPVDLSLIEFQGEYYVSLSDLSKYFPGTIQLDHNNRQLDFRTSQPPLIVETEESGAPQGENAVIWGRAFTTTKKEVELPISGMNVYLRKLRNDMPIHLTQVLFYSMVMNGEHEFNDLFPAVREIETDEGGLFMLKDIPAGNYQLTARYQDKKITLGWRWILEVKKGANLEFELSEKTAALKGKGNGDR